ncbi:MAG: hypothetical protein ACLQVY_18615, partial [Limisphaerales bacterium]
PTEPTFALCHAGTLKNFPQDVPQKVLKPLTRNELPGRKGAPYSRRDADWKRPGRSRSPNKPTMHTLWTNRWSSPLFTVFLA